MHTVCTGAVTSMRIGTGSRKSPGWLASFTSLLLTIAPSLWGQSTARLDSVNQYIRSELTRQHIPGASVTILRGDSVVLSQGYGWANIELRVPASDSTIYQSGSMGKQFTAAGIMLLVGRGRLRLEDRITKWLPEGKGVWDSVTIRHLLTHTAGMAEYTDSTFDYRKDYTEDQLVRFAASRPLDFVPGQRWSYSNTGYLLLGVVIHRVTGQFYGDVLRRLIFEPVRMNTTRVISEADIIPNRAAGYQLVRGQVKNQSWVSPSLNTTADGALYFSVKDLARWAVALDHGPVPGKAVLDAAWAPVHLNDGGTYPYGFGWDLTDQRGHRRIGHTGSWQGFKTALYRYPEYGLSIMMLTNLDQAHPGPIVQGIAGILEPALLPPHLIAKVLPAKAPSSLPALLTAIAAGSTLPNVTDGLRRFIAPAFRRDVGDLLQTVKSWTVLGCDHVAEGRLNRLGSPVERICYARGIGSSARSIVAVSFTADSVATFVDWYDY